MPAKTKEIKIVVVQEEEPIKPPALSEVYGSTEWYKKLEAMTVQEQKKWCDKHYGKTIYAPAISGFVSFNSVIYVIQDKVMKCFRLDDYDKLASILQLLPKSTKDGMLTIFPDDVDLFAIFEKDFKVANMNLFIGK